MLNLTFYHFENSSNWRNTGTITIGATNSSDVAGIVTAAHTLALDHDSTFLYHEISSDNSTFTKITDELVPVHYGNNVDVAFIPITEPNIVVGSKVQALNGTVIDVSQGLLENVARGERLNIYGIFSNGDGLLLFKNATVFDRELPDPSQGNVLSNMGV